jgi:hypothetical protein
MDLVTVKLGSMGSAELREFIFQSGATVEDLLNEADIELQSNQTVVMKGGGKVELSSKLTDGAIYFITTDVKGGNN